MADQVGRACPLRLRARVVRGEPYQVGEVTIVPEARVVSLGRARATIGSDHVSGGGAGFVNITPVAVVVSTPLGERRVPIVDVTASALFRLGVTALAFLLLGMCIRWLARRR